MFVVVSGNVDPNKVIELIKENQEKKEFKDFKEIKIKEYKEPDKVEKEKEVLKLNVTIPKVTVNYKINLDKIKSVDKLKAKLYVSMLFDLKFGSTSLLNEQLREENIITDNLELAPIDTKSHLIISILGETTKVDELIKRIKNELKDLNISEEELERKKRVDISSLIYMSDNVYRINHKIMNDINRYGYIIENNFEIIKELNIKEFNKVIKELDLSNNNIVIVDKKGE